MDRDRTYAAWAAAAADAGIDPADVNLWLFDLPVATGGFGAVSFLSGHWPLPGDGAFPLTPRQRAELYERRDESFILISTRHSDRVLPLLLRHEAEHLVQAHLVRATSEMASQLAYAQGRIEGSGFLYFTQPHERDADAAATRFGRRLGITPTDAELVSSDRMLFSAPWPDPDPSTVALRQLAFSLLMPDAFRFACEHAPRVVPEELLDALVPASAESWTAMSSEYQDVIRDVLDHGVDKVAFDQMTRLEQLRFLDELRAEVVQAEGRIVAELQRRITSG